MIVKIIGTGPDPGGLVRYAFGRGDGNEHTQQRTVAGTCYTVDEGQVTRQAMDQVADDLRAHARLWGKEPKGGHVQHIVISLNPGDRPVSDTEWRTITEDYLTARGITDPGKAGVRWTAINHGRNSAGADHCHLIVSLVRSDGTQVSTWQDGPKSQKWAQAAEQRYGLVELQSRAAHAGAKSVSRAELAKARDTGREPVRVRLADVVRPIAAASTSEVDYIQRLRAVGLDPRPRVDKTTHRVTGYSVAAEGQRFGGGTLAPDLRLPALRRVQWDPSNGLAAAQEWAHPTARRTEPPSTRTQLRAALAELERESWQAPLMTAAEHRAWSARAAGITAAAARVTSDPAERTRLLARSRELARWAGPTDHGHPPAVRRAAQLVAAALGGNAKGDRTSPDDGALLDTAGSIAQIAQMHRATQPGQAAQPPPAPRPAPGPQPAAVPGVPATPVPVQPVAVRPSPRRQPTPRRLR